MYSFPSSLSLHKGLKSNTTSSGIPSRSLLWLTLSTFDTMHHSKKPLHLRRLVSFPEPLHYDWHQHSLLCFCVCDLVCIIFAGRSAADICCCRYFCSLSWPCFLVYFSLTSTVSTIDLLHPCYSLASLRSPQGNYSIRLVGQGRNNANQML